LIEVFKKHAQFEDASFFITFSKKMLVHIISELENNLHVFKNLFTYLDSGFWGSVTIEEAVLRTRKEAIRLEKELMSHLAVITVGTCRGILHSKTEGIKFNQFYLPTINVDDLISDEVTFDLKHISEV